MEIGLYVHIPFCLEKCRYCDFLSFASQNLIEEYVEVLVKEIKSYSLKFQKGYTIKSIFIGGGTPTVLPPFLLSKVLEAITQNFCIKENAEWTIEANPGTLTNEIMDILIRYPVNRISLGLQASQDKLLKRIGRIHTFNDWERSMYLLLENGIKNINTDIMFSLPGQTLKELEETLERVTSYPLTHMSAYGLIIEEDTPFGKLYKEGKLDLPSEEEDRSMYYLTKTFLRDKGFEQYELSNWAKNGNRCKHNILYWKREPYIGIGLGAHSLFNEVRYANTENLNAYIKFDGNTELLQGEKEEITKDKAMEEYMFLGLRLTEGISIKDFEKTFHENLFDVYGTQLTKWLNLQILIRDKERIYLSDYGMDVSNQVFASFLQ